MNGYICLYNRDRVEVYADSSFAAQLKALALFQAKTRKRVKGSDISVMLAEKGGEEVIHTPVD